MAIALDLEAESFVLHIIFLAISIYVYFFYRASIAFCKVGKMFTPIILGNSDFSNILSLELIVNDPKYKEIDDDAINFVDGKQLLYLSIYNL